MGIRNCQKCKRSMEEHLELAPKALCYICLTEEVNFLGIFKSISLSGLQASTKDTKCCICSQEIVEGSESCKSDYGHICESCFSHTQSIVGSPLNLIVGAKKKWILKSSLQIQGPYDSSQVEKGIRAKNFSGLDEVALPLKMSSYIRDIEEFKEVIRQLSKNSDYERTIDITKSLTQSQFGTDPGISVKTRKQDFEDVSFKEERNWQASAFNLSNLLKVFAVVAVLLIGILFFKKMPSRGSSDVFNEQDIRLEAKKKFEQGFYEEAFSDYQAIEAHGFSFSDAELIQYALLFIEKDQQISGKRLLERIQHKEGNLDLHLAMAKFHFSLGNKQEAIEALNLASAINPSDDRVKLNRMYIDIENKDYGKVLELVQSRSDLEEMNAPYGITRALFKLGASYELSEEDLQAEEQAWRSFVDFRSVLFSYLSLMAEKNGQVENSKRYLLEALNFYPYRANAFKQNLFLFVVDRVWEDLLSKLKSSNLPRDAAFELSIAMAQFQLGHELEAKESIALAIEKNPNSDLVESWNMLIHKKETQIAATNLDPLTLDSLSPLHLMILGDQCIKEKKWECANQVFQKVLANRPKEVYAIHRLVDVLIQRGNPSDSKTLMYRSIGIAPRYKPILSIEQELGQ